MQLNLLAEYVRTETWPMLDIIDNRVINVRNHDLLETLHTVLSEIAKRAHNLYFYLHKIEAALADSDDYNHLIRIFNNILLDNLEPWAHRLVCIIRKIEMIIGRINNPWFNENQPMCRLDFFEPDANELQDIYNFIINHGV